MAKRFHPDADTGAPHSSMARINEAWRVLSDAARRARWDRAHSVVQPMPWAAPGPVDAQRRPSARPTSPPESRDSAWLAVGVVAAVALLTAVVMVVINTAPSGEQLPRVTAGALSFANPHGWDIASGDAGQPEGHQVLAHVVTFGIEPDSLCTSFDDPCALTGETVPPGEASIVITAWEEGTPPVPDPLQRRTYGLDAQRIIGDEPAAFRLQRLADSAIAWWQLSPPGFPDRWIEVRADIGGQELERTDMIAAIDWMLASLEFED